MFHFTMGMILRDASLDDFVIVQTSQRLWYHLDGPAYYTPRLCGILLLGCKPVLLYCILWTNVLCYDITMSMISLGNENFSALL